MAETALRALLAPDDLALLRTLEEGCGHTLGVRCIEAGLDHRQKGLAAAHKRMLYMEREGLVRRADDRKPIIWLRTPEGSEQLRIWDDPSALPASAGRV